MANQKAARIISLFFSLILLVLVGCSDRGDLVIETNKGNVYVKPELAITGEERRKGLMHREYLDEDAGMLFVFEEAISPSFWMKNTLIALDMIFISEQFEVVDIKEDARPCKTEKCPLYGTKEKVRFVLETNSGFVSKNQIEIGDKVRYKLPDSVLNLK